MERGTIEKILDYYLNNKKFNHEIRRAMEEFFDLKSGEKNIPMNEELTPFFNDWLVYDFKLQDGHNLLEDYYYRNPYNKNLIDMQIYKDLQTNTYGLLEALKIDPGLGLKVRILNTGEEYYIREYQATFNIKEGNLFYQRVGKVGDHFELVGADSYLFDVRMEKSFREAIMKDRGKLTPKETSKI